MYHKGEYIVYGTKGPCKVDEITYLDMSGCDEERQYYVLTPLDTKASTIYSPVDNQKVFTREVISPEQAEKLMAETCDLDEKKITNEKLREEEYKNVLRSCDPKEYIRLMKTLVARKEKRIAEGKKFTSVDERYLSEISQKICLELGLVLGKTAYEVNEELQERITGSFRI